MWRVQRFPNGGNFQYDSHGNQTEAIYSDSARNRTIDYSAADQAVQIRMGNAFAPSLRTRFWYGPDGSRYQREDNTPGASTKRTLYIGNLEIVSQGGITTTKRYVAGVLVQDLTSSGTTSQFLFHDHIGSVVRAVSASGVVLEGMDYGAFGERRGYTDPTLAALVPRTTARGFTGHEMIDGTDVVHMNGRIYDSALGRFLQADPIIQEPNNPQNFNRYSYVLNNPLSLTDPSGFNFLGEAFKFLRPLAAIAISIYAPGLLAVYLGQFGSVVAAGFLAGVVSTGTLKGGLVGAFSAAAFAGVGSAFDKYGTRGNFLGSDFSRGAFGAKVLSHGITGGVMAELQGGKFGSGFAAAGVTQAFSGGIDGLDQGTVGISAERVFAAAVLGGTTSALTGGKFANGAITGAFSRAFNDEQELRNLERERRLADEAITRSNAALRSSGAIGREFSSIDEASIAFADAVLPMANELGVEIASQFTDIGNGKILLSLATSDGRTGTVNPFLAPSTGAQPIGFIHTHPDAGLLSGWDTSTALSYVSGAGKVFVGHAVVVNAKGAIAKWDTKYQRQDYVRFRG